MATRKSLDGRKKRNASIIHISFSAILFKNRGFLKIKMVNQYLEHAREILTSKYSTFKGGSKGAGLISLNGYQNEYDLRKGFPLLTTKKMFTRGVIEELIWFFSGDTNIKYLEDRRKKIVIFNSVTLKL